MLRQYGPDVPEDTLRRLVEAFSELREMADTGLLAYPYSTREVVNIVKHLQVCCVFDSMVTPQPLFFSSSFSSSTTTTFYSFATTSLPFTSILVSCFAAELSWRGCGQCGEECV